MSWMQARRAPGFGRFVLTLVMALSATACIRRPPEEPIALRVWPDALGDARRAIAAGSYASADTTLARFARAYGDSEQARESMFMLALFRLDPKNSDATPADAVRALDTYLSMDGDLPRAQEAHALKRLAVRLDSLAQRPARPAEPNREEELVKLREELKRTTDELDRIKRRLAQPRP